MAESSEKTVKRWKLRVNISGEEPELLPKVEVSTVQELKDILAKEFESKLNGKPFTLKAMDEDFGDFFTLTDKFFESLPEEGHRDIQVIKEGEKSDDPSRTPVGEKKDKPKSFDVERKEIKDEKTGEVVDTQVIIVINSRNMRDYLRGEISNDELYEVTPRLKAHELLVHLKTLRDRVSDYDNPNDCPFYELVEFLNQEYGDLTTKLDGMIKEGVITFPYLWYLFKKGVAVYGTEQNTESYLGGEIANFSYRSFMMFSFFSMSVNCFVADGQHFYNYTHEFTISEFKGLKKLSELPVRLLDEETKEKLTKRGHIFRELGLGAHYRHYRGNLIRASWFGPSYFKSDGRVMIDGGSFRRMNPNYANDVFRSGSRNNASEIIDDSSLWMTWPSLLGFSFSAKKWGELKIETLTEIQFDDSAFERLVLAPEKKQMVKALVENQRGTFADIITGKGGGCIFLLHGSPGVGKTLTAEAIAELLHRPLYSVSVGELGTSTDVLEERLREILEVASTWNAVVLLDEADIFLEKRTEQDIKRNAMVGIFLRLLEYHQGVMFLTTNRVRSFDPAFHSRISVALKYKDLDEPARKQIWANFLEITKIDIAGINLDDLAKYDINGRQIKTAVRLAQALAKSEGQEVGKDHILRTLGITEQFKKDMLRVSQSDLY